MPGWVMSEWSVGQWVLMAFRKYMCCMVQNLTQWINTENKDGCSTVMLKADWMGGISGYLVGLKSEHLTMLKNEMLMLQSAVCRG